MQEIRKYTVVDLFAGVGGLSYGFSKNEHYEIILANEMQKDIAKAYTLNHPTVNMLQGDIKDLSEDVLRQAIGNRTVDVVVGGPPCQSYSTLGKRQMDARANLFMEYKRVLRILHPRAFLFENVKGILSMDKGTLFEHVRKEFEDIGYNLQYFRYNNQWVTNKLISYEVVDDGQNIKFTVEGNSVASYYTSMANVVLMHKDENNTRTQNIYEKLAEGTTYG